MTLDEWYQTCKQEIDSAFTDENRQEGLEYPDECY
nr:MAG TPA: hypothetical protein [Caudoviricetes sp.]